MRIPFNRASIIGREYEYVRQAVENGHLSGNGPFARRCETFLEQEIGCRRVLLTSSCTHALEMAALLIDIQPGDEVIVPSFTFVSTVNAFVLRGATPVFSDIRPDTLNIDEAKLEALLSPRTKAVVVVHYAGIGCEMDSIMDIASRHGIQVVEDNAHGLFGRYCEKPLGSFGCLATQSFHETKNLTSGEGGALVINSPELIDRAEILREKGTNRSRFFRGEIDKYTWVDVGSSYLASELQAAFLWGQMEQSQSIQSRRAEIWRAYRDGLSEWARQNQVQLPTVPENCQSPWHMFHLIMPNENSRDALISHLRAHDIYAVFHYLPLHLSPMGRAMGGSPGDCPVTEDISARLLRLPFYAGIKDGDIDFIRSAVRMFSSQ